MSSKKSKPGVVAALPIPPATTAGAIEEDSLEAPIRPVLEEIRALCEAILPPDMAADTLLAVELYVTTHPQMRERLHAMLARRIKESAELGAPPASAEAASPEATAPKRAGRR